MMFADEDTPISQHRAAVNGICWLHHTLLVASSLTEIVIADSSETRGSGAPSEIPTMRGVGRRHQHRISPFFVLLLTSLLLGILLSSTKGYSSTELLSPLRQSDGRSAAVRSPRHQERHRRESLLCHRRRWPQSHHLASSRAPAGSSTVADTLAGSRRRPCQSPSLSTSLEAAADASDVPRGGDESSPETSPKLQWNQRVQKTRKFVDKNFFLVGMFVAVAASKVAPALGKNGGVLRPELFIGKFGVTLIFLLSGLSLELKQISDAASNYKLNLLIQFMTFVAWPFAIGVPSIHAARTLLPSFFPQPLLDGLLMMTMLPTTVNMYVSPI